MPFTLSHVAAVIPLIHSARVRKVLDPWAVGVGAMVPDLPMFLPYLEDYSRWHSPLGIVTDDVAAVFVLLALLQFVFRDPLTALLPGPLAAWAAALPGPAWRRFPTIALGAAVGAATHVFWDSFTHDWGAAFWGWAWLTEPVFGWVNGYRLLQYVSSAAGLAVVAWWLARALRASTRPPTSSTSSTPAPSPPSGPSAPISAAFSRLAVAADVASHPALPVRVRWGVLAATGVGACVSAGLWTLVDPPNPVYGWAGIITKTGVGLVVGLCAVLTLYVLSWQLARVIRLSRA
ncbi:DUF4184 family protein [Sphaerisporangium perillae]|uniref:DUF4184 family protein n=1 Tax=Sphaerisporangium perillae TaxID=2935860 RepID=UPI00200D6879|nr:DUF4184 family protein [Sphaerisporangium perillae]